MTAAGADVLFHGQAAGWEWIHLAQSEATETALLADVLLPDDVGYAMVEEDTQPRSRQIGDVTLLILRGINELTGAEPEDMVSLRLALTGTRIVSVERRRLRQIDELIEVFDRGAPPETPGRFVLKLVEALREAVEPVLDTLEAQLTELERHSVDGGGQLLASDRTRLPNLRQDVILLHRYIAPQSVALHQLIRSGPSWLSDHPALEEEADSFHRIAADLDALRSRAQVVAEELSTAAVERTNRIILILSVVSVVFLPLTFLTGLVGVNLAGIPFAEQPWAFTAFCLLLLAVAGMALALAIRLVR